MDVHLDAAIAAAMDGANPLARSAALAYTTALSTSPNSHLTALGTYPLSASVETKFFCLGVIGSALKKSTDGVDYVSIRKTIWPWLGEPERFLRLKVVELIILCFRIEYLTSWTNFWNDVWSMGEEIVLDVAQAIHDEIVSFKFFAVQLNLKS